MDKIVDTQKELQKLVAENTERLKELSCINYTTLIIREGKPVDESLQKICALLPKAWQYPQYCVARITYDNNSYTTPDFEESQWRQMQTFQTIDDKKGTIEVYYTREFSPCDEGPFLKEERNLIENLSNLIAGYINSLLAKLILHKTKAKGLLMGGLSDNPEDTINSRQLLQRFLNKQNYERDVFHDLMPFKVREILIVANLYDAYNIEKEGRFVEHFLGEYYQLNLTSMPRVTGVSSSEEVFSQLRAKHFDLIIFMMGVDKNIPAEISKEVKQTYPYIPIYLLLNNSSDIEIYHRENDKYKAIDDVYVWNGDPKVFFAMVKLLEDKVNIDNDTTKGFVKVILLVEDSAIYYSRYLPLLYTNVLLQTQRIIEDVSSDELLKVLRLRARPKILLAKNYEDAIKMFDPDSLRSSRLSLSPNSSYFIPFIPI